MSPASQGNLEVERYIGSCLISARLNNNNHRNKGSRPHGACECARYGSLGRHTPVGWAGMPLISMAVNTRRHRKPPPPPSHHVDGDDYLRTPLSRLAIHTQGAPLILTGHYGGRKNNVGHGHGHRTSGKPVQGRKFNGDARNAGGHNVSNIDCISVASDESSGHSENSLPRIIKPRKRRKKDRKPAAANNADADAEPVTESSTIVTLKPYVPLCQDLYDALRRDKARENPEEEERVEPNSEESVQLEQDAEEAEDADALLNALFPYRCAPSVCQCRYCDPSGLIWDVDQHCYSPFLTPPSYSPSSFVSIPLFLSPPSEVKSLDLYNKGFENSSLPLLDADHKEPVRRSWSEPSASLSAREGLGVIGDARHMATSSDCALSQSLEVSTEIVTSLNGHRDIEIKFYSSSPPSAVVEAVHCESDDGLNRWSGWRNSCGSDGDDCNINDI